MIRQSKRDKDALDNTFKFFLNQPNINMVIPWIYEIHRAMEENKSESREAGQEEQDEKMRESLKCFLNQPNINMVIPWVYDIYTAVKSGAIDGGGQGGSDTGDNSMYWGED